MIEINIQKELYGSNGKMTLDINTNIKAQEFIGLSGHSGSGKTTLLRIIAGLESSNGTLKVDDIIWYDKNTNLPPQKRDIGFVFQEYALFPNMTILQNLLFIDDDKNLANHLLNLTELSNLKDKYPNNLSGGQKQRVSLCRALMGRPRVLLMDEPFAALDLKMREKLQNEILILHKEFKITTIIVSHDIVELNKLCDRILILDQGEIVSDTRSNT